MTPGPGHNGGPTLEPGAGWRRLAWARARADLLPHLPVEVLRGRLRRAADLGLDYRTYAGIRAASGHDVVAVLFSSNALAAHRGAAVPAGHRARVAAVAGAARLGLAVRPLRPEELHRLVPPLDAAHAAPAPLAAWGEARAALRAALGPTPGDRAILVGAHRLEADWVAAAALAGFVPAGRFFGG
jgi:hypothetical protein